MKNLLQIFATVFFLVKGGLLLGQTSSCYQPKNNLYTADTLITFSANKVPVAANYRFQISSTSDFLNLVFDTTLNLRNVLLQLPNINTQYYWRTKAYLIGDSTNWSSFFIINLFSPKNVSKTILWLSSKNINLPNNTLVASWNDLSNYSYHASQANSALKPLYKINGGVRNNAYVDFVGSDGMATAINNINIPNDSTLGFISLNINRNQGYGALFFLGNSGSFAPQYAARTAGSSYNNGAMRFLGYNGSIFTFDLQTPNSSHKIITGINTKLTAKLFSSGILMTSSNANVIPVAAGATLKIGSNQDYLDNYNGGVHELIMLRNTSDTSIYHKIEKFIDCRYVPRANLGGNIFKYNGFCDSMITLSPGTGYASYLWSTGATTPTINVNTFGNYSVTVTDEFGYVHYDQMAYRPNLFLRYPSTTLICSGDSILWNPQVPAGYTVHWSDGSIGPINYINSGGSFSFDVQDAFSCSYQSNTIIFNLDNYPFSSNLGADTNLCVDNLIALQAGAQETINYEWNGLTTSTQAPFWVVDTTGNYFVETTNVNGCVAQDTIHITIIGQAPLVNFSFQNQCFGLPNQFNDASIGLPNDPVSTWQWDFGNGDEDDEENPNYTYAAPGLYSVQLYAESAGGCGAFHTELLEIHQLPLASFTHLGNCEGQSVNFTNTSVDGNAPISTYLWNFDQQGTNSSTLSNPSCSFMNAGIYQVALEVSDTNGCSDTVSISVDILASPNASFSFNNTCETNNVLFNNTSSVSDTSTIILNSWDYGDNTQAVNPSFAKQYQNFGQYNVQLIVQSSNGCSDTNMQAITIHPNPILAWIIGPSCKNSWTSFSDSSTIPLGTIIGTNWEVNLQYNYPFSNSSYQFLTSGIQYLTLSVTSDQGCISDSLLLVDVQPELMASYAVNASVISAGTPITFINQSNGSTSCSWTLSDGTTSSMDTLIHSFDNSFIDQSIELTMVAGNSIGCFDTITSELQIVDYNFDIALTKIYLEDINGFINLGVEMKNEGAITMNQCNLWLKMLNSTLIQEQWSGELLPGESEIYIFTASPTSFVTLQDDNYQYICVEAQANNVFNIEDEDLSNNNICANLENNGVIFLPISPNPATNNITLTFYVPKDQGVMITMYDAEGRLIYSFPTSEFLEAGMYSIDLNTSQYAAGSYIIRMQDEITTQTKHWIKN